MICEFSGNSPSLNARNVPGKSNISTVLFQVLNTQRISSPGQSIPLRREGYGCEGQCITMLLHRRRYPQFAGVTSNTDEGRRPVRTHIARKQVPSQRESLCLCPNVQGCWTVTNMCALASWTDNKGILPDGGWESKSTFVGTGKTPEQNPGYQYCQQCL